MVDRYSRCQIFNLLRKAVAGRVGGFDCDNAILILPQDDRVISAFRRTIHEMVGEDDCSLQPVFSKITKMRKRLPHWLLFLKTDFEYRWPDEKLPAGILDYYRPTMSDRLTGERNRIEWRISKFMESGDYHYWPFISKQEYDKARLGGVPRRGLRLTVC